MHYENTFQECDQMFLKMGIGKILVEPGAFLFGKLLESKTYDQLTSFICPKFFKTGAQILSSEVINFNKTEIQIIGNNIMINYFSRADACSLE
jgi:riboflavin biosynthesis pyrimidine reductase